MHRWYSAERENRIVSKSAENIESKESGKIQELLDFGKKERGER